MMIKRVASYTLQYSGSYDNCMLVTYMRLLFPADSLAVASARAYRVRLYWGYYLHTYAKIRDGGDKKIVRLQV